MPDSDMQQRIWTALEARPVCMVSAIVAGEISTRPMSGHVDRENHRILFVAHRHGGKLEEAVRSGHISIAISQEDRNFYAAIACAPAEIDDRELLRRVWTPMASAWFPAGPDDPDAALLALTPVSAEIWDGPSSSVLVAFKLAKARILGRPADLGVNATIDMR
jgi:general stress protein 26